MASLVSKVKGKLSIHVRRRSVALLDGGYASVHKGRSMDFDDLREYAVGDDIRDIDWKASARHGSMLIKRYVAERHFSLIIVMPAGREMAATAAGGEPKRDIAVLAAGHADLAAAQAHGAACVIVPLCRQPLGRAVGRQLVLRAAGFGDRDGLARHVVMLRL